MHNNNANNQKQITLFRDEYFFLSNFYPCRINYCGLSFTSAESAFQAMKNPAQALQFVLLTPSEAKRRGRSVSLRSDWEQVKEKIMYEICLAKFTQNADLKEQLLKTGDSVLIEGNTWNDTEWGVCRGNGDNKLGKILMRIRDELRKKDEAEKKTQPQKTVAKYFTKYCGYDYFKDDLGMNNKIDWIIHLVVNGVTCADCGKRHYEFLPYTCNVHTHGMEKYGHLDFQIVLELSQKMQMYILNALGLRVQAGEKFKAGDIVSEICQGYDLKLVEAQEAERTVLRVLIPDEAHKFPGDEDCDTLYALQSLPTEELQVPNESPIIRLYQISCDHPDHRDCIYESSLYVKNKYGAIPSEMYECVFAGVLDLHTPEDIFHVFNNRHPLGYKGRSMSVSDVVEFEYSNGKRAFYYCNSAGFEIVEFDLDKIIRKNLS